MIALVGHYLRQRHAARFFGPSLRRVRDRRLSELLVHAASSVPFYRDLFRDHGIDPRAIRSSEEIARLPVVTKRDLQAVSIRDRLSERFDPAGLEHLKTTGSTGYPFDIYRDRRVTTIRKAAFLRSLTAGRYRYPMRFLGTGNESKDNGRRYDRLRWTYVSNTIEPQDFKAAIRRHEPAVLYGALTALRQLVDHLDASGDELPRMRAVYTTAEALDRRTAELIRRHLAPETFELYGSSECGPVAWECTAHDGLHLAEDLTIVELVPDAATGSSRLVATSLDLWAMPLIRYEIGDLARAHEVPDAICSCGCRFARLRQIEGRQFDTITLPDRSELSPIHLTHALEEVPGLRRFQVRQEEIDRFVVRIEDNASHKTEIEPLIQSVLRPHLGEHASIEVDWASSLEPPPGHKFRTVENRLRARVPS